MKPDAFEDLGKEPFNYEEQLDFAREALKTRIADYIRRHPEKSYRDLKNLFGLSVGAICGILRLSGESRLLGRPSGRRSKPHRNASRLSTQKIPQNATEEEQQVYFMLQCIETGERSEAGDHAFRYMTKWVAGHRRVKWRAWVIETMRKYEALPEPQSLEQDVLGIVRNVLRGSIEQTPDWLMRPGREECGDRWPLVARIYHALTGLDLPETMPIRERRAVDCILKIEGQAPLIIEIDEKQHFNPYRAKTLRMYPEVALAFDRDQWISQSELKTRLEGGGFGKPKPPLFPKKEGRHQQRAFRDALTDILPTVYGFQPTLRIAYFEVSDWLHSSDACERMRRLIKDKFRCAKGLTDRRTDH